MLLLTLGVLNPIFITVLYFKILDALFADLLSLVFYQVARLAANNAGWIIFLKLFEARVVHKSFRIGFKNR